MHQNSVLLFKKYLKSEFFPGCKVLEIAPIVYPSLYSEEVNDKSIEWFGLDIRTGFIGDQTGNPLFVLSEHEFNYPFEDNYFDFVFSDQVIAHVRYPWVWLQELKRITKLGGKILTIGASSWPPCPSPIDCWRIYPDGMRNLNEFAGLETQLSVCESGEFEYYNIPRELEKVPNAINLSTGYGFNPRALRANKIKLAMIKWMRHVPMVRALLNPVCMSYDTVTISVKNNVAS